MSKKETLQDRMDEVEGSLSIISKEITEITQILKGNYSTILLEGNYSTNLEAIAAKIINDLSDKIDKCECSKEILNYLKENNPTDPICKEIKETTHRRYTPPNFMAGPNVSIWPPKETSK